MLNERLSKLVRYGIVRRESYPEIPPRVEYRLSEFGSQFIDILDRIEALQMKLDLATRDGKSPDQSSVESNPHR